MREKSGADRHRYPRCLVRTGRGGGIGVPDNTARRSRDEVADSIRVLRIADWGRLKMLAQWYIKHAKSSGLWQITPDDLLQEAFLRALESRSCPITVDVVTFLNGIMRSTISGELEKIHHRPQLVAISEDETPPDTILTPEEALLEQEKEQRTRDTASLFDDKPLARMVYEGLIKNLNAKALREITGLGNTAYQSTLKLIRRRLNKQHIQWNVTHDCTER